MKEYFQVGKNSSGASKIKLPSRRNWLSLNIRLKQTKNTQSES
jgi:hypothetical protein